MKELLNAGLLHGDCLTVTGKTVEENLRDAPLLSELGAQVYIQPVPPHTHPCMQLYQYVAELHKTQ